MDSSVPPLPPLPSEPEPEPGTEQPIPTPSENEKANDGDEGEKKVVPKTETTEEPSDLSKEGSSSSSSPPPSSSFSPFAVVHLVVFLVRFVSSIIGSVYQFPRRASSWVFCFRKHAEVKEQEKKKELRKPQQKTESIVRYLLEHHSTEVRQDGHRENLLVFGARCTGKSSFINTVLASFHLRGTNKSTNSLFTSRPFATSSFFGEEGKLAGTSASGTGAEGFREDILKEYRIENTNLSLWDCNPELLTEDLFRLAARGCIAVSPEGGYKLEMNDRKRAMQSVLFLVTPTTYSEAALVESKNYEQSLSDLAKYFAVAKDLNLRIIFAVPFLDSANIGCKAVTTKRNVLWRTIRKAVLKAGLERKLFTNGQPVSILPMKSYHLEQLGSLFSDGDPGLESYAMVALMESLESTPIVIKPFDYFGGEKMTRVTRLV